MFLFRIMRQVVVTILSVFLICPQLLYSQDVQKAEEYIQKAQKAYRENLEYDSARANFFRAAEIFKRNNLPDREAHVYYQVGMSYYIQSDYTNALKYAYLSKNTMTDSVSCHVKLNNDLSIGRIKYALRQKEESIAYVQGLAHEIAACDINIRSLAMNYMAVVNYELGHIDSAEKYLYRSLELSKEQKDTPGISQVHSILGELYMTHRKDYPQAYFHIQEALQLAKSNHDLNAIGFAHIKKATYFIQIDQAEKSFGELDTAENAFRTLKSLVDVIYSKHNRADAHRKLGNADSVHAIWQEINVLNDSLYARDRRRDLAKFETQFNTQETERQNLLLTLQNEKQEQRNRLIILISILVLATVLGFGLYLYGRYKNRLILQAALAQEQSFRAIVEAEEKERVRIAKDLHDGLGQILSTAKLNIVSLDESIPEEDRKLFDNSIHLVDQAVSEVRNVSHDLMPGVLIELGLGSALQQLIDKINDSKILNIVFNNDLQGRLSSSSEIALYRVVQEVVNNMIKHAEAKQIEIKIKQNSNEILLQITDDGKGFDLKELEKQKGIGWQNIFSRIKMLQGKVELDSRIGFGTKVKINIPETNNE